MRIAISKDGHVYQIEAPARTKIFYGRGFRIPDGSSTSWSCFDQICLDGELYLARHVLDMARVGETGFRVVRELPMDRGCPPGLLWIVDL
jgi:hypothetical protein